MSEQKIFGDQYPTGLPSEKVSTSIAAAQSMEHQAESMRSEVERFIRLKCELGATDDEIETALHMRHQTASARRRELVLGGFVVDSGYTRLTTSGRKAKVWIAKAFEKSKDQWPLFIER